MNPTSARSWKLLLWPSGDSLQEQAFHNRLAPAGVAQVREVLRAGRGRRQVSRVEQIMASLLEELTKEAKMPFL